MIGILSTFDNPLLPGYLANLRLFYVSDIAVICDSRGLSDRQQNLFLERLGGWNAADHFNFNLAKDASKTPFFFVNSHNSVDCLSLINDLGCSFLLNGGTPRKLDPSILDSTKHGVLNVHPGKLPQYRGKNCPEWAVFDEQDVVLTAHIMESEYDEGDVIGLADLDWRSLDSYVEFRRQVHLKSFELAARVSSELLSNTSKLIYNSRDSAHTYKVHDAMDLTTLELVKSRFSGSL